MSEKYQGCTNYETWSVGLWFDNDEGLYRHWQARIESLLDSDDEQDIDDIKDDLAVEIKNSVEPGIGAGDGLTAAGLLKVNWDELAQDLLTN